MKLFKDKSTRTLSIIVSVLVVIGIITSNFYYKSVNKSIDPRVVEAREMYGQYNSYVQSGAYEEVLLLLDSIEAIYSQYPHYKNSFETGVLYNNRAAVYLTVAMIKDSMLVQSKVLNAMSTDELISRAEKHVIKCIELYENWKKDYIHLDAENCKTKVEESFLEGMDQYSDALLNKYINNRIHEIESSCYEIDRRLSVAYTNYGIIYRNREQYELALQYYKKAVDLWDRNLTAENNINILLGRPQKKRNIIQNLFPPTKEIK